MMMMVMMDGEAEGGWIGAMWIYDGGSGVEVEDLES